MIQHFGGRVLRLLMILSKRAQSLTIRSQKRSYLDVVDRIERTYLAGAPTTVTLYHKSLFASNFINQTWKAKLGPITRRGYYLGDIIDPESKCEEACDTWGERLDRGSHLNCDTYRDCRNLKDCG